MRNNNEVNSSSHDILDPNLKFQKLHTIEKFNLLSLLPELGSFSKENITGILEEIEIGHKQGVSIGKILPEIITPSFFELETDRFLYTFLDRLPKKD